MNDMFPHVVIEIPYVVFEKQKERSRVPVISIGFVTSKTSKRDIINSTTYTILRGTATRASTLLQASVH